MNGEAFATVVGIFMPMVVELLKKLIPDEDKKNRTVNYIITLAVACSIGGTGAVLEGNIDTENILSSVGMALIASQGAYNVWFKGSEVEKRIAGTK